MTAADFLAQAHAVIVGATPGPWEAVGPYIEAAGEEFAEVCMDVDGSDDERAPIDATFIAASRTMLPAAVAAIEAVLALHRAVLVYGLADDCGCSEGDPDWDDHHYSTDVTGDLLCDKSPTGERWCGECSQDEDGDGTTYPCPTVRDITAHLDPS